MSPGRISALTDPAYQQWNSRTYSGPPHVGLTCGVGDGMIRVMNLWGGFWHEGSDRYWAARLLEGEVWVGTMMIPVGWKDDGKTLVAPNGVPVVRRFRDYILAHGWLAGNYPLKPEAALDSIEPGNASIGAGSRQDFRLSSLGYTTTRGVYVIWVGQDLVALESQLAAANSHVTALEQQIDPKATEALAAVRELAKALSVLLAVQCAAKVAQLLECAGSSSTARYGTTLPASVS